MTTVFSACDFFFFFFSVCVEGDAKIECEKARLSCKSAKSQAGTMLPGCKRDVPQVEDVSTEDSDLRKCAPLSRLCVRRVHGCGAERPANRRTRGDQIGVDEIVPFQLLPLRRAQGRGRSKIGRRTKRMIL
jgi:hypothetical protein